jgi:hypothetical protein
MKQPLSVHEECKLCMKAYAYLTTSKCNRTELMLEVKISACIILPVINQSVMTSVSYQEWTLGHKCCCDRCETKRIKDFLKFWQLQLENAIFPTSAEKCGCQQLSRVEWWKNHAELPVMVSVVWALGTRSQLSMHKWKPNVTWLLRDSGRMLWGCCMWALDYLWFSVHKCQVPSAVGGVRTYPGEALPNLILHRCSQQHSVSSGIGRVDPPSHGKGNIYRDRTPYTSNLSKAE